MKKELDKAAKNIKKYFKNIGIVVRYLKKENMLKVGIIGVGTVGTSVANILRDNKNIITARAGVPQICASYWE